MLEAGELLGRRSGPVNGRVVPLPVYCDSVVGIFFAWLEPESVLDYWDAVGIFVMLEKNL